MAEEISKFHQGWLYAREDGLEFAPYTVTTGVYNPDKTLLSNTIDNLNNKVAEHSNSLESLNHVKELGERFGIPITEDTFYIVDAEGNIAAQIDKNGVTSVDFIIPDTISLKDLSSKIGFLANDNAFYIVDPAGNIIFQVDASGAKSIDFTTDNGTSLDSLGSDVLGIKNYTNSLNEVLKIPTDDEKFVFAGAPNSSGVSNIIAQIDAEGVKSVNFKAGDANLVDLNTNFNILSTDYNITKNFVSQNTNKIIGIEDAIGSIGIQKESIPDYILGTIENSLLNVNLDDSDVFYIVDDKAGTEENPQGNVIMKVDNTGVNSIDFNLIDNETKEVSYSFSQAKTDINSHGNKIASLNKQVFGKEDAVVTSEGLVEKVKHITSDATTTFINSNLDVNTILMDDEKFIFSDAPDENGIANVIAEINNIDGVKAFNFTTKEGNLNNVISRLGSAEGTIAANTNSINKINDTTIPALKTEITNAYEAADSALKTEITEAYKAADSALKEEITGAYSSVDENLDKRISIAEGKTQNIDVLNDGENNAKTTSTNTHFLNNISVEKDVTINGVLDVDTIKLNSDKYDFFDTSNNVIASIDKNGVNSFNFVADKGNLNDVATRLGIAEKTILSNSNSIDTINTITLPALEAEITDAYKADDAVLKKEVIEAFKADDVALKTEITNAYKAVDENLDKRISAVEGKTQNIDILNDNTNNTKTTATNTHFKNNISVGNDATFEQDIIVNVNATINGILDVNTIKLNSDEYVFLDEPDGNNEANVIAKINSDGVNSFNFIANAGDLNDVATRLTPVENQISTLNKSTLTFVHVNTKEININI